MAVLAGIAIPSLMSGFLPHRKLKSTAMDIYATLQMTRSKAIGSTTQYGVRFDLSANPVTYNVMTRPNASSAWSSDPTFAARQIDSAVRVNTVTVDGTNYTAGTTGVIRFENVGTAASAKIDLSSLSDPNDKYSLLVSSSTGRVKIQSGW